MPNQELLPDPRIRRYLNSSQFKLQDIQNTLDAFGILLLQLSFPDQEAIVFKKLIAELGESESHDKNGTGVWNIKFDAHANPITAARSLTNLDFKMHTDASFEPVAPKYIAMYVLQEDRLGGGVSKFIDGKILLPHLSLRSRRVLIKRKFRIRVPAEFAKGVEYIDAPLLDQSGNFRFREELILKDELDSEQIAAIAELKALLEDDELAESVLLKTGTILLLDNRRFFHARTEVKDPERHLLRMRFNPKQALCLQKSA